MGLLAKLKDNIKNPRIMIPLTYLGGHPNLQGPTPVAVGKEGDNLVLYGGLKLKPLLSIPKNEIVNLTMDTSSKRSLGKAAIGAAIGGALTGGVGLLAGAAIGGRSKDNSVIVLTVQYEQATCDLIFSGNNVNQLYGKFASLLR